MAEYEIFKYADSRMPSRIAVKHWRRMLMMETKTERIQYLTYLYDVERLNEKEMMEKNRFDPELLEKVDERRSEIQRQKTDHIYYGIGGSCMFRRILDSDMVKFLNNRLARSMTHGPHIIFDMSFYPEMRPVEVSLTSKQLIQVHHVNRAHRFPHHIIFSGCKRNHPSWEDANRYFKNGIDSSLCSITEKHYLDIFPREQLVYLSPDAKQTVNEYDPNKVYIIAAMVDRVPRPNLTLGRAKEEGIEARRLPLERCVRIIGRRALCLDHLIGIMNDAHALGSITTGMLNHLPKRKVAPTPGDAGRSKREYDRQRLNYLRSVGKVD